LGEREHAEKNKETAQILILFLNGIFNYSKNAVPGWSLGPWFGMTGWCVGPWFE